MTAKFLQIHTLHSYPASLLNRDDVGLAKRIRFGSAERTRISSQCLKRHWRTADDEMALQKIDLGSDKVPTSVRSRRIFEREIFEPLVAEGIEEEHAAQAVGDVLAALLPEGKKSQGAKKNKNADKADERFKTQQVIILGRPEIVYLKDLARELAQAGDTKAIQQAAKDRLKDRELRTNLKALRMGAGIGAAMFGRMVTGDVLSRCDAAIHVAHAFTVHTGFFETDYFSAVDELEKGTGSGHINTAELSSGVFYGYVVVDLPLLVSNLEGCDRREWNEADKTLAKEAIGRLLHLIAKVSPGAKLGATAPYAHAHLMLAETGRSQPRSLANAFLEPVQEQGNLIANATTALARELCDLDGCYGRDTERALSSPKPAADLVELGAEAMPFSSLADWVSQRLESAT